MEYLLGEFLGSLFLILFGGGVVANVVLSKSKGNNGGWITITAGWAFAVMIGVFVATSSGSPQADINPAVTLAKYFLGVYDSLYYVITASLAQIAGCFVGASLVWLTYLPHWKETEDKEAKLAVFCTSPAIAHSPSNLITEIIGTVALIFGIGAIVSSGDIAAAAVPYLVAMLVWGIGLSLGGPTGYAINPARDLGPRIAHAILPIANKGTSQWHYAWVPIIGPLLGAILAATLWNNLL